MLLNCLKDNTKVTMADFSQKDIEDIKLNDEILGFGRLTHKTGTVTSLVMDKVPVYLKLHFESGKTLNVTGNHEILVKNRTNPDYQFIPAGSLGIGDEVCMSLLAITTAEFGDTDIRNDMFIIGYMTAYDICCRSDPDTVVVDDVKARVSEYTDRYNDLQISYMKSATVESTDIMSMDFFGKCQDRNYMLGFLSAVYDLYGYIDNDSRVYMKFKSVDVCVEVRRINKYFGFKMSTYLIDSKHLFEIPNYGMPFSAILLSATILAMIKPAVKCKSITAFKDKPITGTYKITYIEKINEPANVCDIATSTNTYIANGICVRALY